MPPYRRDRGFNYKPQSLFSYNLYESEMTDSPAILNNDMCHGNIIFSYMIPSILHLVGYLYTVYLFRIKENEQLQNLMERAFLLSSTPGNRGNQKRLVRILWLFIGLSVVWMIMTLTTVTIMMVTRNIVFQWVLERYLKISN